VTCSSHHIATLKRKKESIKEKNLSALENAVGGNGTKFFITKKKRKLTGKRLETFEQFWDAFAYKSGKAEAADSWLDIPELTDSIVAKIMDSAKREAEARPSMVSAGKTPKMAQGWISGRRWEDEITAQPQHHQPSMYRTVERDPEFEANYERMTGGPH